MRCPHCGHQDNKVVDSRLSKDGRVIRRRRECGDCERRFTTYERIEEFLPMVVKKEGTRESFDRQKVIVGLKKACEKRRVSADTLEEVTDELERLLQEDGRREVSTAWIGEWVMRRLRTIDEVAYVRFASVYRSFRDIGEFMDELKELLEARNPSAEARIPDALDEPREGEGPDGESVPEDESRR